MAVLTTISSQFGLAKPVKTTHKSGEEKGTLAITNVLSVSSELFPLIKTGGLADVTGALPSELATLGIEVRSLLPGYPQVLEAIENWKRVRSFEDLLGTKAELLAGYHEPSGLDILALRAPEFFERPGNPYLDPAGQDWPDNHRRFAALAYAAALIAKGVHPAWTPDVVHAHDWQAGLAAFYIQDHALDQVGTVFTIHNIAFQGVFAPSLMGQMQLPSEGFTVGGFEYYGQISMLKAGISYSDQITTVSPTYAREIQTPAFGMGMEGLLRRRSADLRGIVNGIDADIWNPATDQSLINTYDSSRLKRRAANKTALQERFGLDIEPERPLFCIVSRLTNQKGMDLVLAALDTLVERGGQLALIGSGEPALENAFIDATQRFRGNVGCFIGYDEAISHQLQGGSDAILVPSRFEPCGLTQLYGLRYGCVPIVSRVGGLADTVIDANYSALQDGVATGFQLGAVDVDSLIAGIERAIDLYRQPNIWQAMQKRGMGRQLNWAHAAELYAQTYQQALDNRSVI